MSEQTGKGYEMVDLEDFGTLAHGMSDAFLCDHLDISTKTLNRWKTGHTEAPKAMRLLLRFINWGELESIGGKDWEGFTVNKLDHRLTVPLFHGDFNAKEIAAMFFTTQDAWQDKRDLKTVQTELTALRLELTESNKRRDYYHDQLKQAGREYIAKLNI